MKVYRSNRVEALFDALVDVVREPAAGPLQSDPIVVHSRAMAVWLSMRLAERFDGWVGGDFPFPARLIDHLFHAVLGESASTEHFSQSHLFWSVLVALPELLPTPPFEELQRYIADDPRDQARVQLAARIAQSFDRYIVYRPQMILQWDQGAEDHWQARLWRSITARQGASHGPAMALDMVQRLEHERFDPTALPPRICVFGISTLPPFHMQILGAVSEHVPVHLFILSASQEYWAELRSGRQALRDLHDSPPEYPPAIDQHNPLLSSWGGVGRDFQLILERELNYEEPADSLYREPTGRSMLEVLQADVLHLRHRNRESADPEDPIRPAPRIVQADDRSITVHACHSPMREVEVLHDQLVDLLAGPHAEGIGAHHIVVLMTDVETYAPLVEAVFERDPQSDRFIPYCIADRSVPNQSPTVEAFGRVLGLVGSRVSASAILDLLSIESVHTHFDLSVEDLDVIGEWIGSSGIRWGIDAKHRAEHGQPPYDQNTWRFGLQRLLLGYGLPGQDREMFASILPYDEIEGQEAERLGKLAEFCERLFGHLDTLGAARNVAQWQHDLGVLAEDMLTTKGEASWEHHLLRGAIEGLVDEAQTAGFDGPLPLESIRSLIEERLENERPAQRFLAGGVTFCAMVPMRSIPFEVVCLLGMSDGAFPRAKRTAGFDLVAQHPQPGDRSGRSDDRYLFLEAILAARRRLIITYVGQSIQDNRDLPPSVVVSELLDVLDESFYVPSGPLRPRLILRHPMQPFSPRYFGADPDPRLWSYQQTYESGARALYSGRTGHSRMHLFEAPLPAPHDDSDHTLELGRLVEFFQQPTAQLLRRRLGINLKERVVDRSDREPMELDTLERWRAGTQILGHRLDNLTPQHSLALLRAMGLLPLGAAGESIYGSIALSIDPIVTVAQRLQTGPILPHLPVDLSLHTMRVIGQLGARWPSAIVRPQFGPIRAKHLLDAWIHHLVLCAVAPSDQTAHTVLVGRPKKPGGARVCRLRPVEDAVEHLDALIDLYQVGQRRPLLLFPRSSLAYVLARRQGKDDLKARTTARTEWSGHRSPENSDPYLARLFADTDPLHEEFSRLDPPLRHGDFVSLSHRVFDPLLDHLDEGDDT